MMLAVFFITAVLTAHFTPFVLCTSPLANPEAQRLCEILIAASPNQTNGDVIPIDARVEPETGAADKAKIADNADDKSADNADVKPATKAASQYSVYFCHPSSSRVFLRCGVEVKAAAEGKAESPQRVEVMIAEALACEPGTFFNSFVRVWLLLFDRF